MTVLCTVLDDYQGVADRFASWDRLAPHVRMVSIREHLGGAELVQALDDSEIVVAMRERTPITAELLARLPNLRLLVTTGMRNNAIDLDAASRRGVLVCGTRILSVPAAELAWALVLAVARGVVAEASSVSWSDPAWQHTVGRDLDGANLGIVGLGKVGARVAGYGRAFGMSVSAWSQNLTPEHAAAVGATLAPSLMDLMTRSDFVSVHLALSDRTWGIIGADELAALGPRGYLINTARGPIVDESALVAALRDGVIAGAGIDVYDAEPLPLTHPLRSTPHTVALPHVGYVTEGNYSLFFEDAVEDIVAFFSGSPVRALNAIS